MMLAEDIKSSLDLRAALSVWLSIINLGLRIYPSLVELGRSILNRWNRMNLWLLATAVEMENQVK